MCTISDKNLSFYLRNFSVTPSDNAEVKYAAVQLVPSNKYRNRLLNIVTKCILGSNKPVLLEFNFSQESCKEYLVSFQPGIEGNINVCSKSLNAARYVRLVFYDPKEYKMTLLVDIPEILGRGKIRSFRSSKNLFLDLWIEDKDCGCPSGLYSIQNDATWFILSTVEEPSSSSNVLSYYGIFKGSGCKNSNQCEAFDSLTSQPLSNLYCTFAIVAVSDSSTSTYAFYLLSGPNCYTYISSGYSGAADYGVTCCGSNSTVNDNELGTTWGSDAPEDVDNFNFFSSTDGAPVDLSNLAFSSSYYLYDAVQGNFIAIESGTAYLTNTPSYAQLFYLYPCNYYEPLACSCTS